MRQSEHTQQSSTEQQPIASAALLVTLGTAQTGVWCELVRLANPYVLPTATVWATK